MVAFLFHSYQKLLALQSTDFPYITIVHVIFPCPLGSLSSFLSRDRMEIKLNKDRNAPSVITDNDLTILEQLTIKPV